MRRFYIIAVLALCLFCPVVSEDSHGTAVGPIIDMVNPTGSSEGFSVRNNSFTYIDLVDYYVTDGEGTVRFTQSLTLGPGQVMTFLSGEAEEWLLIDSYIVFGTCGVEAKGFSLNDNGDDVHIFSNDGTLVDSFVYGDCEPSGLWEGEAFRKIPKKKVAIRNNGSSAPYDGERWKIHVPGRTLYHYLRTYEDCVVTPFSFPESDGLPVIKAVQQAEQSFSASLYTLEDKTFASALRDAVRRGVDVTILVEGSPVGGLDSDCMAILKTLENEGAEVLMMRSYDSYKRFSNLHTKYAVIDGDTVVVTSENWTEAGFSENRGWGVIVENRECAEYVQTIFRSDSQGLDVVTFGSVYSTVLPAVLSPCDEVVETFKTYIADVSPVISPDYSRETLMWFLDSAETRLYSQQLSVDHSWMDAYGPLTVMEEAEARGVDVRLQVDVTYDSPYDDDAKDGYTLHTYYRMKGTLNVRYSVLDKLVHNKGIISDDSVWIGSINWTGASLDDNREMAMIVHSEEVTDIYARLFLEDWGPEFDGTVELNVDITGDGRKKTLDASGSTVPFGSEIGWDLDGDGEYESRKMTAEWTFFEDTECTLTVVTPDGELYTHVFTVGVGGTSNNGGGFPEGPLKYIPAIVLVTMIIAVKRIRGNR